MESMFSASAVGQSINYTTREWGGIFGVIALGIIGNIIFTVAIRYVSNCIKSMKRIYTKFN